MKNIVLIHCKGGYKKNKFYQTIKSLCQKNDWFIEIDKIKDKIDSNSILIGHSMGAIAICSYISENNLTFNQLHLVAP